MEIIVDEDAEDLLSSGRMARSFQDTEKRGCGTHILTIRDEKLITLVGGDEDDWSQDSMGSLGRCNVLQKVDLSGCLNLKELGFKSMCSCNFLETVIFPEGLEEIGLWALAGARNLKHIRLPPSVRKVGPGAFSGCPNLGK